MKTIITFILILIVSINTQAQKITSLDSVFTLLNQRITKLETDTVGVGNGLDYNRLTKVFSVNQIVLNQLSTMQQSITLQQTTILNLQNLNRALEARLNAIKVTTVSTSTIIQ